MSNFESELRDSWRLPLSIPSATFADHRKGDGFTGILLPTPSGRYAGKGYRDVAVMEPRNIRDGNELIVNPNFGQPLRWPDGRIKQQTVLTLLTDLSTVSFEGFASEKAIERFDLARTAGEDDDLKFIKTVEDFGLRQLFIQGGSLEPNFRAAVRALTREPQVGATVEVRLEALEPNVHGGKTKIYGVKYSVPDVTSLGKVEKFMKAAGTFVFDFLGQAEKPKTPAPVEQESKAPVEFEDNDEPPF